MIEPIPHLYTKCKKLRKRSIVYNYALVENASKALTIQIHDAGLMSIVDDEKNPKLTEKHLNDAIAVQRLDGIETISVPARTLESILDECHVPKIDFFSLDVEGYELNVLKGMNIDKYRPRFILVEMNEFDPINRFLEDNKYTIENKLSPKDYLYIDNHSK